MSKKIGIVLSDEAWAQVEALVNETNESFESGKIGVSDAINEMVLCSKVDIKALQIKHMDLRKSLRALASRKDIDIEAVLKTLSDLKGKTEKRKPTNS